MKEELNEKLKLRDELIEVLYKYECSIPEFQKLINNTNFWLMGTDYKLKRDRILKRLLLNSS